MPIQDAIRLADSDVDAAAEHLAKVAVQVRRAGPLAKRADVLDTLGRYISSANSKGHELLAPMVADEGSRQTVINALAGAGVGGLGLGALGAVSGKKPRRVLNDALRGVLGGAALGGVGSMIADRLPTLGNAISTPAEDAAAWKEKPWFDRLVGSLAGHNDETSFTNELVGSESPLRSDAARLSVEGAGGFNAARKLHGALVNPARDLQAGMAHAETLGPEHSMRRALANPAVQQFKSELDASRLPNPVREAWLSHRSRRLAAGGAPASSLGPLPEGRMTHGTPEFLGNKPQLSVGPTSRQAINQLSRHGRDARLAASAPKSVLGHAGKWLGRLSVPLSAASLIDRAFR